MDERHKHLVAAGMMGVFKKIWENVWSARMEYILNNVILALLDNPGSTLLGINRMLSDEEYRNRIVGNVKDPIVKQFWVGEFASWDQKFAAEASSAIQNKIGQFLSASIIRNIVAQVKSSINIREMMDQEKIFIVNLSKGRIGEDASRLLGGMLITKIQLSAMERVDMPETDRKDFYLYVDEFQNFAVESFAAILSEARKYRLCLVMAHQYIAQLSDEVREAVFGNVGTMISFRVGSPDALFLEKEFEPRFMATDIVNLPKYNIYLKLLIDGVASQPFSASTLPPIAQRTGSEEKILRITRERYGTARGGIEDKISKWTGLDQGEEGVAKMAAAAKAKKKAMKDSKKPRFEYNCSRCNKQIILPVELDTSRPIYCEECIEIVREERKKGKKGPGAPPPRASSPPVERMSASAVPPSLTLAELAAKAAAEAPPADEEDEAGPAEADVPDVPLAELAALAAKAAPSPVAPVPKAIPPAAPRPALAQPPRRDTPKQPARKDAALPTHPPRPPRPSEPKRHEQKYERQQERRPEPKQEPRRDQRPPPPAPKPQPPKPPPSVSGTLRAGETATFE